LKIYGAGDLALGGAAPLPANSASLHRHLPGSSSLWVHIRLHPIGRVRPRARLAILGRSHAALVALHAAAADARQRRHRDPCALTGVSREHRSGPSTTPHVTVALLRIRTCTPRDGRRLRPAVGPWLRPRPRARSSALQAGTMEAKDQDSSVAGART
jgi:hypothetical protein